VSVKQLLALARRRGCRIERTRDGHFLVYAPDGTFLAKLKATNGRDVGDFRRNLRRQLLALPVPTKIPAPVAEPAPAVTIPPAPHRAETAGTEVVVASPEVISWRDWTAAEFRRGTRAARRRQWRSEITQRLPEAS
jgi:hypothetical protein